MSEAIESAHSPPAARNRWFHRPAIHSPAGGHEKKVTWLELFYDLIYVATLIQLGNALASNVSVTGYLRFAGLLLVLWLTWTSFTFYANRFVVDDFLHRILIFAQMFLIGGIAVSIPDVYAGQTATFSLLYAGIRFVLVGLYARTYLQLREARGLTGRYAGGFAIGASIWLASAFVPAPWTYVLWAAAGGIDLAIPFSRTIRALVGRYPPDVLHMSERYGLLTLIVLGESFVKALTSLADAGGTASHALMGGLGLIVVTSLWWIYFDDVAGSRIKRGALNPWVWIYSHLPMMVAVTAVGVAMKKALFFEPMGGAGAAYRWLLCFSLGLALFAVGVIDSVTERRQAELSDRARVQMRMLSALFVLLLAPVGGFMPAWAFVAMISGACLVQVLFDMSMAPLAADHEEIHQGAQEIFDGYADGEDEARDGAPVVARPRRRDLRDAVRKGTPSELRRDLYFHFMEGSWTRLLVSLIVAFLAVNGIFAALYLLESNSVSNVPNDSFLDAFFFSVQTMSTIGYGVMAPESQYAHFLVTAEAVIGIVGTALATGLFFAKASRPSSSVLFARPLVVTDYHGVPTLMFRVGNARGNEVVEAHMRVTVLCDQVSPEGHTMRRLYDLELERANQPIFALSWTVMHRLTADSPLCGLRQEELDDRVRFILASMTGHDATYAQTIHARHFYEPQDFRFGHRYIDVISELDDGRLLVDYDKFHLTEPDLDSGHE